MRLIKLSSGSVPRGAGLIVRVQYFLGGKIMSYFQNTVKLKLRDMQVAQVIAALIASRRLKTLANSK